MCLPPTSYCGADADAGVGAGVGARGGCGAGGASGRRYCEGGATLCVCD